MKRVCGRRWSEDGGRKTEDGRQKTEDGRRRAEGGVFHCLVGVINCCTCSLYSGFNEKKKIITKDNRRFQKHTI